MRQFVDRLHAKLVSRVVEVAEFELPSKSAEDCGKTRICAAVVVEDECVNDGGINRNIPVFHRVPLHILMKIDLKCFGLARAHVIANEVERALLNLREDRSGQDLAIVAILHELDVGMLL